MPVQAKVKTDARISFSSPNYHLSAANCLGGGGDDDAGDDNGDQMMTICHRLTYSCNEESRTLGQISEAVTSHHRLWPLKISFIYL